MTQDNLNLSALPRSPAGERARWTLERLVADQPPVTEAELRCHHDLDGRDRQGLDRLRTAYTALKDAFESWTLESVFPRSDHELVCIVSTHSGRRFELEMQVHDSPPNRIINMHCHRALPPGVEIRQATREDRQSIRRVYQKSPIEVGDYSLVIDPGEDFFDATRLMGGAKATQVAVYEGEVVGVLSTVAYPVRLNDNNVNCVLVFGSRVLPAWHSSGIWMRLNNGARRDVQARTAGPTIEIRYIRPQNTSAQRLVEAGDRWSVRPFRAIFDCAVAGKTRMHRGRPAEPSDADKIVSLLNGTHRDEALFVPYTRRSLASRLETAHELYSWNDFFLTDRAVIGVPRLSAEWTYQCEGTVPIRSRRSMVFDFGYEAGAEEEFLSLLQTWAAHLAGRGVSELGVFSSPGCPTAPTLGQHCSMKEEYDVVSSAAEPSAARDNGIYVDPVYF